MSVVDETFETIRIETPTEHLAQVVLDRPEDLNTISDTMLDDLEIAVDGLEDAADIRGILITGAGDRAFSAGADLGGGALQPREAVEHSRRGKQVFGRFRESDLPVVAGIDGYCLGGGLELSMCADLRVSSSSAEFGLPEHNRGGCFRAGVGPSGSNVSLGRVRLNRSCLRPTASTPNGCMNSGI